MKRLFKTATAEQSTNEVNLKQEEAFYTKRHYKDKKFKSVHNEKLHPLDKNGKVSKCVICGSKMHWVNKCPHRSEQNVNILEDDDDDNLEEMNIVLMTEKLSKTEIFVAEASKSAVIDTACTKTIAGEKWFTNFKSNLTDDSIFPIVIAGKHCRIEAEIVKENITLLLSRTSLKRCNMIIDLPNDKAKVFDREIDLQSTTSGNYCINILPDFNFDEKTELPNDKKRGQMMKIHKQFGHATADNILKLLNNANIHTSDISLLVKEVVRSCSTGKKFRKPSPRPVVGFSKADDFNQTVSVDLHELKSNLWYLHIVDEFTRYSAATLVNNKSLCAKAFIKTWILIFGAPQKIFNDNGALHAARKAFIETESSSKLKLALKKNLRPTTGTVFSVGDEVYYKRDDSHERKGPGKVLGHDEPVVFIRQGSRYIKAHTLESNMHLQTLLMMIHQRLILQTPKNDLKVQHKHTLYRQVQIQHQFNNKVQHQFVKIHTMMTYYG